MPVDYRRNQGPEESEDYRLFLSKRNEKLMKINSTLSDDNKNRRDGRRNDEMRKIYVKTGVVSQAKGSAYIELNQTKVLVSVFEPREIPRLSEFSPNGEIYCEFKYAPFSCPERRGHLMDGEERDCSVILKRAIEPAVCRHEFPNFQVDIYALVLDNDGSCMSAAITAAGLALADAAIPMYDIIASVTMGIQPDSYLLDPTLNEESACKVATGNQQMGVISLSYMPTLEQITEFTQMGYITMEKVLENMEILVGQVAEVCKVVEQCLVENVKQT